MDNTIPPLIYHNRPNELTQNRTPRLFNVLPGGFLDLQHVRLIRGTVRSLLDGNYAVAIGACVRPSIPFHTHLDSTRHPSPNPPTRHTHIQTHTYRRRRACLPRRGRQLPGRGLPQPGRDVARARHQGPHGHRRQRAQPRRAHHLHGLPLLQHCAHRRPRRHGRRRGHPDGRGRDHLVRVHAHPGGWVGG